MHTRLTASNFTQPRFTCDNLLVPSYVFDNGKPYPSGPISPGLKAHFANLGIGKSGQTTHCDVPGPGGKPVCMPSPGDIGWLSYRLKGSQVNFTDSMGRPTRLANSVTEGGFANTSSCISCHARAGTTGQGTAPPALGVFVNLLGEEGYGQSNFGIPVADWYHRSGQPPTLEVLQTEFVWGFLSANRIHPAPRQLGGEAVAPPAKPPALVRARTEMLPTPPAPSSSAPERRTR
ncbi:hypothetical protein HPC50_39800 [Corallococcus exiguus]|uniref:hypothetical protein n=1 Tax=Corallococcus TaxID=83461 RepID=UPI0011C49368|nr:MULTISPECIES: hypothetical protein [Corallococcus]NPC53194.1 hypothetical protein [Corallococcus exiguus]